MEIIDEFYEYLSVAAQAFPAEIFPILRSTFSFIMFIAAALSVHWFKPLQASSPYLVNISVASSP